LCGLVLHVKAPKFRRAGPATVADDDVVENVNAEHSAGAHETGSEHQNHADRSDRERRTHDEAGLLIPLPDRRRNLRLHLELARACDGRRPATWLSFRVGLRSKHEGHRDFLVDIVERRRQRPSLVGGLQGEPVADLQDGRHL
jgi:hypothetical protein